MRNSDNRRVIFIKQGVKNIFTSLVTLLCDQGWNIKL